MPPTDLTSANRTFFDNLAARYDIHPWQTRLSHHLTTFIRQNIDSILGIPLTTTPKNHTLNDQKDEDAEKESSSSSSITLLDYACGTGMISRALGPSVTSIRALDLSSEMVARYNALAAESDIPSVRAARAVRGNLLLEADDDDDDEREEGDGSLDGPEWSNFDVVAVGVALHHFPDAERAIGRLAGRLKGEGGVLVVVDFVEEGEDDKGAAAAVKREEEEEGGKAHAEHHHHHHLQPHHDHDHDHVLPVGAEQTIHKHGFRREEIKEMMERCGLRGFRWLEVPGRLEMMVDEQRPISRKGFVARAVRGGGVGA